MKQYKRLLAAGLMVVMIASLTGCATNNKTDETVAENIESVTGTADASTTWNCGCRESFTLRLSL